MVCSSALCLGYRLPLPPMGTVHSIKSIKRPILPVLGQTLGSRCHAKWGAPGSPASGNIPDTLGRARTFSPHGYLWVFRVRGKFATQLSSKMPPNRPRETTGPKRRGLGRSAVMMGVSVLQSLAHSSLCRDVEAKVRRAGLHVAGLGGHDNARN